ncbi:MAG TPA: PPOX class F420-dependent oxidoreductase [Polyangiales bacterium]|nr:PPOX class F420-dependent oxidoreductase [Polyangiales bacterium]
MSKLPDQWKATLKKPVFIHLSTVMPDGSPQTSPVWVDIEDDTIVVNSAQGRLKDKNMRRDPRVAISVTDPDNPYAALNVRGKVTEITTKDADAHIDSMAKKYLGKDKYPFARPGEQRVIYRITPEKVSSMG